MSEVGGSASPNKSTTPPLTTDQEEESDEYYWDTDPGDLSFFEQTSPENSTQAHSIFGEQQGSTADWPAPRPSSEEFPHYIEVKSVATPKFSSESRNSSTDNNFLESGNKTSRSKFTFNLEDISEHESSVFDSETEDSENMPSTQRALDESLAKFRRAQRSWTHNFDRLKDDESISHGDIEDMRTLRKNLEDLANDIYDIIDEDSDEYVSTLAKMNKIGKEMSILYKMQTQSNSQQGGLTTSTVNVAAPTLPATDPDILTEKGTKKLLSVLEFRNTELDGLIEKINAVVLSTPDPTVNTVKNAKEILESCKSSLKAAEDVYLKLIAECSTYESADKLTTQKSKSDASWKLIVDKVESIKLKADTYTAKLPVPELNHSVQSSPLERLPLPKFSGKSVDYIRFKLEFHKYVTYKTEAEKVLAIKERCLPKISTPRSRWCKATSIVQTLMYIVFAYC